MSARLPAPARREQILDVALTVFATTGYHGASMNDVAEAAGVTKPVLYQHFGSKDGLYQAVLTDIGTRLRARIEAGVAAATGPHDQVRQGFRAYLGFVAEERDSFRVLFGRVTQTNPAFAAERSRTEESIALMIADLITVAGMPRDAREAMAYGIVGMAEGAARRWDDHQLDLGPAELAELLTELAWAGLRGTPPETDG